MIAANVEQGYAGGFPLGEVPIDAVDRQNLLVVAADGTRFCDVDGSLWAPLAGQGVGDVRYVGSAHHGGGIMLKALYARIDGTWFDVRTGEPADARTRALHPLALA